MDKKEETGRFLQKLRAELGISQADLAGRAGVSRKQISDWECGRKTPSGGTLLKIIRIAETCTNQASAPATEPAVEAETKA